VSTAYRGGAARRIVTPAQWSRYATVLWSTPSSGTDLAERPAGGVELGGSVHIHDQ
jgi:hypothetical protein